MAILRRVAVGLGVSAAVAALLMLGGIVVNGTVSAVTGPAGENRDAVDTARSTQLFERGRRIFRFDTFGDEAFWGGALRLHRAIEGKKLGGVGPGVSPNTALAVGLKVDVDALPQSVKEAIANGQVDLDDPATTLALLELNSVVGVKGFFNDRGTLRSVGITCGFCHSTVDDSFAKGIGHRLDGWPNRDLNVGAVIGLAPNKKPITDLLGVDEATVNKVLAAWGPGKFDAELFVDGKGFRPDGKTAATLLPPAFGLAGVNLHTSTGWGSVTYWNAFVANLEMHGQGTFFDPRLKNRKKFPVAAKAGLYDVRTKHDRITSKLPALEFYQKGLLAPKPPKGSFDVAAAARGERIFNGKGRCATCHVPPLYTEPGWNMHKPSEICTDAFQANRSPDGRYRTTPLKGLFAHSKGGFWHDGRFPTLRAVVRHYNGCFGLGLTAREKTNLVQFLKGL
jgi:hypothetical protein